MGSWTDLPGDIVECILRKLDTPIDYLNFGAVCKPWHSISVQNYNRFPESFPICNFYPKACPLPMLLVPIDDDVNEKSYLYSITNKKSYSCLLGSLFHNKSILGSVKGWLLTVDTKDKSVNLLNPLTAKQIPLPGLTTFRKPEEQNYWHFRKATVLFDASGKPENSLIVALASVTKRICFCKAGHVKWRSVKRPPSYIEDIISFHGKLFGVDILGRLFNIKIGGHVKWTLVAGEQKMLGALSEELYLVESGKQILLVVRDIKASQRTVQFRVFGLVDSASKNLAPYNLEDQSHHKMDGVHLKWVELESIGEQMIFLGYNHSLSVDSRAYPGCQGNRVYFTYLNNTHFHRSIFRQENHDIGVYDFKTKRVEFMKELGSLSRSHALWLSPCV